MSRPPESAGRTAYDLRDVSQVANYLTSQACTVSAQHIKDGSLRLNFNRDVAYYARGIVRDVEQNNKTPTQGMAALLKEKRELLVQAAELARKGVGVVAGAMQMKLGAQVCYGSAGLLCPFLGVPLMAHGANNVYENSLNLTLRRDDAKGPLRALYQHMAVAMGGTEHDGNIVFGTVDLALSVASLRMMVLKPGSWRLFRYVNADYVKAYVLTGKGALTFEAISNGFTLKSMQEAHEKK